MEDNPFQSPIPANSSGNLASRSVKCPQALKTICIISLILGALGLLSSTLGLAGLIFQPQIAEFQPPTESRSAQAIQTKMLEFQSTYHIPNILMNLANLIISPLLLLGGIGVLSKLTWAPKILSIGLVSACVFVLVRTTLTSFMQFQIFSTMKESIADQLPQRAEAGTIETVMVASMYFGLAMGIVWMIALAGFYFWSWHYLKQHDSQAY